MFEYLIEKVAVAELGHEPFKHVYIDNFLSDEHFAAIANTQEIALPPQPDDQALFESLFELGYKIVNFPGCTTDMGQYLAWHSDHSRKAKHHTACEGFGMTLRLVEASSTVLQELNTFL